MKNRQSMFMFGMRCVRCDHEIIAPMRPNSWMKRSFAISGIVPSCKARFESFPRFPKDAKLVKEVMKSVDVFPLLNGT
jgi:hypothetical protein